MANLPALSTPSASLLGNTALGHALIPTTACAPAVRSGLIANNSLHWVCPRVWAVLAAPPSERLMGSSGYAH